ncbi:extracellular solute-binding protein [Halosimplex litoreum]|uniref:Extracellular solute-binding protein n=1 Tax=Halosimplex litoreum TaxID=1198301 RepID=A0A7T3FYA5_9EURY|nr:extracellular solute-binding protein [Halosimplex litoreum]QPV62961.1 extracellular solute-binding protein [Halosimplex litoreum]
MSDNTGFGRRRFVKTLAAGSAVGLAGCGLAPGSGTATDSGGDGGDGGSNAEIPSLTEFRGSGTLASGRPAPEGTSIQDLPDLSGDLNLYIGGGEGGIYYQFVEMLQEIYPEFTVFSSDAGSASLAQTIVDEVEAGAAQADVFWSIDASSLGYVANNDAYEPMPDEAVESVPSDFRGDDNAWVGVAGRARSVPYNTDELSESDIPDKVADFPGTDAFQDAMGWAPTYGAFKSFVTAMRLQRGADATQQWLESMQEAGIVRRGNEYVVSQQVADGTLSAGFANHYYAMRVLNQRPEAPIDLAFTSGDAGALVNVAGALAVQGTEKADLVADFVQHLLSAEAQEFFATVSFAYPMIPGVQPVGGLPTVDELNPPEIDLAELANLQPTLELMREAGVL